VQAAEDGSHKTGAPEQREHEQPKAQARATRRIGRVERLMSLLFLFESLSVRTSGSVRDYGMPSASMFLAES
jgi:hypothetical protein